MTKNSWPICYESQENFNGLLIENGYCVTTVAILPLGASYPLSCSPAELIRSEVGTKVKE